MKRDMDTVRLLLQWIETGGEKPEALAAVPEAERIYHLDLLIEAGLIKGEIVPNQHGQPRGAVVSRLTWEGHDFLDASRDPGLWAKAKEKLLKPGASWTFGIVLEYLRHEIKARLHIA